MSFFKMLEKVASVAISIVGDAVSSGPVAVSLKYMNMLNEHRSEMTCHENDMLDEAFKLYRKYKPLNEKFKEDDYNYKQKKNLIDTHKEEINKNINLTLLEYKKLNPENYKELWETHKNSHDLYREIMSFCTSDQVDSDINFLDSTKEFHKAIDEANSIISDENKNLAELNRRRNVSKQPRDIAKQDFLDAARKLKSFGGLYLKKKS
ncbi:hypothetical protein FDW89_16200 [Citrobacter sp. wls830]|nr:hypothetical protein FDW89_16200 [Citrobacter sp. wls830]